VETPWTSNRTRARILPASLVDARDEAGRLLEAAQARAAEVIQEAEHAAEAIRTAARDGGRDEGLAYAQRLLVEIQQTRLRMLEGDALRRNVSELALAMTRRVLGDAWEADPSAWARAVLAVAEPLRRASTLSVRVAPTSVAAVRLALAPQIASGTVEIVEDSTLDETGCIAVSSCGRVDGRLSTMLAAFRGPLGLEEPV
jgi:flagellar biosynthesis/type III secretory pathway protein FliH